MNTSVIPIGFRSATFSTCTKAVSNMMFWTIQNQEINMAGVMIERMKSASAMIWDKKSKINVSLPYAHLLTKLRVKPLLEKPRKFSLQKQKKKWQQGLKLLYLKSLLFQLLLKCQ
ncbi:hypothetical protein Taro_015818 [Colocasia esculenta]|uniref:Uncharacterized protein n=1 Tax=Colocasia esculenta TaxID=4460 RepID=A0A843UIW4_COLES|nr:hypothetical protein [Colocasia esculenta]